MWLGWGHVTIPCAGHLSLQKWRGEGEKEEEEEEDEEEERGWEQIPEWAFFPDGSLFVSLLKLIKL